MNYLKFLREDNKKIVRAILKEVATAAKECRSVEKSYINDLQAQLQKNKKEIFRMGGAR